MTQAIACSGLTKQFGGIRAVDDLSFAVEQGEIVGFLGPNGAGKTTTLRMLLDIVHPTAGHAEILGADPRRAGAALRSRVGYVPGDLALYDRMTGREMLELFAALRKADDFHAYLEVAERLDAPLDRPTKALSRGNRQKIGIVQAFAPMPDVLVLDEPTSGLDPIVQREFRSLVREAADRGAAILLSSHVLAEVQRVAERVAIIRAGRLVTIEPVRELEAKALRVIEIRFAGAVPPAAFAGLPGVREVTVEGDFLRASVAGSVDALIKAASRFTVENVAGHEADLEDVFLAYYGEGSDVAA